VGTNYKQTKDSKEKQISPDRFRLREKEDRLMCKIVVVDVARAVLEEGIIVVTQVEKEVGGWQWGRKTKQELIFQVE
jgi:hypothetical protein